MVTFRVVKRGNGRGTRFYFIFSISPLSPVQPEWESSFSKEIDAWGGQNHRNEYCGCYICMNAVLQTFKSHFSSVCNASSSSKIKVGMFCLFAHTQIQRMLTQGTCWLGSFPRAFYHLLHTRVISCRVNGHWTRTIPRNNIMFLSTFITTFAFLTFKSPFCNYKLYYHSAPADTTENN